MASFHLADSAFGADAAAQSACSLRFLSSWSIRSSHPLLARPKTALQCLVYESFRIRARSRNTFRSLVDYASDDWKSWVLKEWELCDGSKRAAHFCHVIDNGPVGWKSWILEDWELGSGSQSSVHLNEKALMAFRVAKTEPNISISSVSNNRNRFFWEPCTFANLNPLAKKNCLFLPSAQHGLHTARYAQQVLVFVGRALLILGVGLSLSSPALARPAASQVHANSAGNLESSLNKDVKKASKNEVKAADINQQYLERSEKALGDKFWQGIPIPEGSRLRRLKEHLDSHPNDAKTLAILLGAVMEQRDMLRALTLLETLVEVEPDNLEWKFLKAQTYERIGELSMAKQGFEELLRLRPLSARVLQGLVMVVRHTGEEKEAVEYTEMALNRAVTENLEVEAGNLRILLGQIYAQKGNFEEAVKQFDMIIDQDPNDFRAYLCQGLLYSLLDEKVKAEEYLKKYRQLCPEDFPSRSYLDDLMLKVRSEDLKDEMLRKAFKNVPRGKTPKPMKKPFIGSESFPNPQEQEGDF